MSHPSVKGKRVLKETRILAHSAVLAPDQSGELLHLPRQQAGWKWMSFFVHRLLPGNSFRTRTEREEAAFVLLGGVCECDWGNGKQRIGKRVSVFDGLPYALYLSCRSEVSFIAETMCEIAECRVPSELQLEPRLLTPADVNSTLRGGENASRQIVDVISPAFTADKLVVIEVYTPGGNWSSYPPHKHDTHNPPTESDLDEIYYFRTAQPAGFALQHLYAGQHAAECTVKARDGDVVLVHSGYHTVVAGPGYDIYYLNFLAGTSRELAVTDDRDHTWIRSCWKSTDPRLPMVRND